MDNNIDNWSSVAGSDPDQHTESGYLENANEFEMISSLDLQDFKSVLDDIHAEENNDEIDSSKQMIVYKKNVNIDRKLIRMYGIPDYWDDEENMLFAYGLELVRLESVFKYGMEQIFWLSADGNGKQEISPELNFLFRNGNQLLNRVLEPIKLDYTPKKENLLLRCNFAFDLLKDCLTKVTRLSKKEITLADVNSTAVQLYNEIGLIIREMTRLKWEKNSVLVESIILIQEDHPILSPYIQVNILNAGIEVHCQIPDEFKQTIPALRDFEEIRSFTKFEHLSYKMRAYVKRKLLENYETSLGASCNEGDPIITMIDNE